MLLGYLNPDFRDPHGEEFLGRFQPIAFLNDCVLLLPTLCVFDFEDLVRTFMGVPKASGRPYTLKAWSELSHFYPRASESDPQYSPGRATHLRN